jgi:tyrosyl-tRNA synthetase
MARRRFDERFSRGVLSVETVEEDRRPGPLPAEISLPAFLTEAGLTKSNSEVRRLISQGAVRINGRAVSNERYSTEKLEATEDGGVTLLVEIGKRRARRFRFGGQAGEGA